MAQLTQRKEKTAFFYKDLDRNVDFSSGIGVSRIRLRQIDDITATHTFSLKDHDHQ